MRKREKKEEKLKINREKIEKINRGKRGEKIKRNGEKKRRKMGKK